MASPVVTPEWLSSQIEARHKDLRIFDTTIGPSGPCIDEFMSAHIEGAQFFNVKKNAPFTQYLPLGLPDPAVFQDYVRSLGINASSHVILYENVEHYGFAASRAWWLLRALSASFTLGLLGASAGSMASLVVTPEWLSSQIKVGNKDLRIFDTTIGPAGPSTDDFESEHVQGAQFFNLKKNAPFTQYLPLGLPDPTDFQNYVRSLGINASSHVILYENVDQNGSKACRGWWLLRVHGITNVSVLSGGLVRWKKEGHPVTDKQVEYEKGDVTVKVNKSLVMLYDDIKPGDGRQFVDTRHPDNFNGKEKEPSKFQTYCMGLLGLKSDGLAFQTGHIPGAVNIPYPTLFEDDAITFKGKDELLQMFQSAGVKLDQPMTSTCYIGFTACILALAACVCGKDDVSVYYGSWTEYGQRASVGSVECKH